MGGSRYLIEGQMYRLGVRQMREWHERCAAKRAGVDRKPIELNSIGKLLALEDRELKEKGKRK